MRKTPLLESHLRHLKLPSFLENYRRVADEQRDPVMYLDTLLHLEMDRRSANGVRQRIANAHFPSIKTFDGFDFRQQPKLPKVKVLSLLDSMFVREKRNIVFYGPPGVGKTHCLLAIGHAACMNGYRTLFTTAAELLTMLIEAKENGSLTKRLRALERYHLLLIDELGYVPFERQATDLLFQLISRRYEASSVVITTNLAFEQWGQIFPDPMAARAIIDRLIHHGAIFEFSGESYRLRQRSGAKKDNGELARS